MNLAINQDSSEKKRPFIYFIDDEPLFISSLRRSLASQEVDWPMRFFTSAQEAMENMDSEETVIVCDWMMLEFNGLEFCRRVRLAESAPDWGYHYIILITGRQESDSVVVGLETGADDFLTKPFNIEELIARIRAGLRIVELQRKLRQANERLHRLATIDGLTGAFNRRRGMEILELEIERVHRVKQDLSIMLIDLDHYKRINDTYGHEAGDIVLREVIRRLQANCRKYDSVIRWGGDEIMITCPYASADEAKVISERIMRTVSTAPIPVDSECHVTVTTSIGAATAPRGSTISAAGLINLADQMLYQTKAKGRNGYHYVVSEV